MGVDNYFVRVTATALEQFEQAPDYDTLSEMFSEHAERGGTLFSPNNDLRDTDDRHTVTEIVMSTDIDVLDSLITNDDLALMALGYPFGLPWTPLHLWACQRHPCSFLLMCRRCLALCSRHEL